MATARQHQSMKYKCSRCREEKPEAEFYRRNWALSRPVDYYCVPCRLTLNKEARARKNATDPEYQARKSRKKWADKTPEERYFQRISKPSTRGMNREEFMSLWDDQKGACAICRSELELRFGRPVAFVLDHCHASGDNRGILCPKCNLGLGHFEDDPERMRTAAEYVSGCKKRAFGR